MTIGILGAGSIGLHLAGQLALNGKDCVLICRTEQQAAKINTEGLLYQDVKGCSSTLKIKAVTMGDCIPCLDFIFLTVKQPQLPSVLKYLKSINNLKLKIVSFQNGLGHEKLLAEHLGEAQPLFFASTTEGAYRISPSHVRHTGHGQTFVGVWDQSQPFGKYTEEVCRLFVGTSLVVSAEVEMKPRLWKKLIINSCINPLTAILNVQNGLLLESSSTLELMDCLFAEAALVARLEDVEIVDNFMKEIVDVCRNTYQNKSSMLQDIEAGRQTEIDYICGAIVQAAHQHGVKVPIQQSMLNLIKAKQEFRVHSTIK